MGWIFVYKRHMFHSGRTLFGGFYGRQKVHIVAIKLKCMGATVWIFLDFSITQILCEINIGVFRSSEAFKK